jgi:hypothetical protein
MSLKSILWPDKWKVILALLIPLAFFGLLLATIPNYLNYFLGVTPIAQTLAILMLVLLGAILYYPMACGLIYLYKHFSSGEEAPKEKGHGKKDGTAAPQPKSAASSKRVLVIAIVLMLIFNPFTFTFAMSTADYVNKNILNYPCGVEVVGYSSVSPAREAMMVTQEVITMADGRRIDTTQSLQNVLGMKQVNDTVFIQTNVRTYNIKLAADPATGRPIMGIITATLYCPAGYVQNQTGPNLPQAAFDACLASCTHTRDAGDAMENGPCLLDPIPVDPDWVCDIAHSPRVAADNLPENQCSFYRDGKSGHFIEFTPECGLIRAV